MVRNEQGIPMVYPADYDKVTGPDLLETIWDSGPVSSYKFENFDDLRVRVRKEWDALPAKFDPISPALKEKIAAWIKNFNDTVK